MKVFAFLFAVMIVDSAVMADGWHAAQAQTPSGQQPDPPPAPAPLPPIVPTPSPSSTPTPKPLVVPPPADEADAPSQLTRHIKETIREYDEPVPTAHVTTVRTTRSEPVSAPAPLQAAAPAPVIPATYVTRWQLVRTRYAMVPVQDPAFIPVQLQQVAIPQYQAAPPQALPMPPVPSKYCRGPITRSLDAAGAAVNALFGR